MAEPNRDPARPDGPPRDPLAGPGGTVLDQYVLLEQIGTSRMGPLFKARHRLMGRILAVKFLSPEAASSLGWTGLLISVFALILWIGTFIDLFAILDSCGGFH